MSITRKLIRRVVFDAGAVYLNYGLAGERLLGATRGGNSFRLERETRDVPADGSTYTRSLKRISRVVATMVVRPLELTAENLLLGIAGAMAEDAVPGVRVVGAAIRDQNYLSNVALVATVQGRSDPAIIVIENALAAEAGVRLNLSAREELIPELAFVAHFLAEAPQTEPWSITFPDADDLPPESAWDEDNNGDLVPADDGETGGLWRVIQGRTEPETGAAADPLWELDENDDLVTQA
jgi:hypothetical protein